MKIIVCLNAATLDEANIARALLGRTFGPEFRPLEQSAVSAETYCTPIPLHFLPRWSFPTQTTSMAFLWYSMPICHQPV